MVNSASCCWWSWRATVAPDSEAPDEAEKWSMVCARASERVAAAGEKLGCVLASSSRRGAGDERGSGGAAAPVAPTARQRSCVGTTATCAQRHAARVTSCCAHSKWLAALHEDNKQDVGAASSGQLATGTIELWLATMARQGAAAHNGQHTGGLRVNKVRAEAQQRAPKGRDDEEPDQAGRLESRISPATTTTTTTTTTATTTQPTSRQQGADARQKAQEQLQKGAQETALARRGSDEARRQSSVVFAHFDRARQQTKPGRQLNKLQLSIHRKQANKLASLDTEKQQHFVTHANKVAMDQLIIINAPNQRKQQQQRSDAETSSSASSVCSSLASPLSPASGRSESRAAMGATLRAWDAPPVCDLFADLCQTSDEDEDELLDACGQPRTKRFKQASETSVLMMMQHLTRRRNELKVIDERLLNMMNSCIGQLEPGASDVRSHKQPLEASRSRGPAPVAEVLQVAAMDLSQKSLASPACKLLHPKKVRLLSALQEQQQEQQQQVHPGGWAARERTELESGPLSLVVAPPFAERHAPERQQQQMAFQHQAPAAPNNLTSLNNSAANVSISSGEMQPPNHHNQQHREHQLSVQDCFYLEQQVGSFETISQQQHNQASATLSTSVGAPAFAAHLHPPPSAAPSVAFGNCLFGAELLSPPESQRRLACTTSGQLDQLIRSQQTLVALDPRHQRLVASDLILPIVQKMSSFRCHVCHSCFEDRHRLQQHLSIHLNLHPSWFEETIIKETMAQYESRRGDYLCQACQLRYETTAEFDKHMQSHGEKPHQCELCQQTSNKLVSFRYFRQLLTHLRSHCFLFSCKFAPECRQTANRKDYLKLHILKHHLNNRLPEQHTICCH